MYTGTSTHTLSTQVYELRNQLFNGIVCVNCVYKLGSPSKTTTHIHKHPHAYFSMAINNKAHLHSNRYNGLLCVWHGARVCFEFNVIRWEVQHILKNIALWNTNIAFLDTFWCCIFVAIVVVITPFNFEHVSLDSVLKLWTLCMLRFFAFKKHLKNKLYT